MENNEIYVMVMQCHPNYDQSCLLTVLSGNCAPCCRWRVTPTPVKMVRTTVKLRARINLSSVEKRLVTRDRYADII